MDSVEDANNEEAYVEDEPQVMNEPNDGPSNGNGGYIQDSYINGLLAYISNPWIWLLTAIFAYYLIKRLNLNTKYYEWQQKREYLAEAEHVKKNPDFYRQRMEAMERARQKQQEAHDIAAMELAEKERKKEEERRAQKVEQLENLVNGKGYNNKSSKAGATSSESSGKTSKEKTTKSNFRSDYNPLMGAGGSGYRPERRGFSAGGGG